MKIRITDLLDEYLDDDLPLDAMPDILPGDRPEAKSSQAGIGCPIESARGRLWRRC